MELTFVAFPSRELYLSLPHLVSCGEFGVLQDF